MVELVEPILLFLNTTVAFLPRLVAAIVLLLAGWIIGQVVGRITKEILNRLKVDSYIGKAKTTLKISQIFPMILEWLVYLAFIQAAVSRDVLGITALETFVGMILGFVPNLIGAVIVIVVGYIIAEYVKTSVEKERLAYSDIMSRVLFWLIIYIAVAVSLDLVKITPLLGQLLMILTAAIGVGIAIALGLGLKDVVKVEAQKLMRTSKR